MLKQENLAANFCGLLAANGYTDLAIEWRILGQEQDGSILASWVSTSHGKSSADKGDKSHIGVYSPANKSFAILYSFRQRENIIQASINASRTLLSYVIKITVNHENGTGQSTYIPYLVEVKDANHNEYKAHRLISEDKQKQVMTQFLWRKRVAFEKNYQDTVLVFIHDECIHSFKVSITKQENNQNPDEVVSSKIDFNDFDAWCLNVANIASEIIVKHFIWAQWDPVIQALYYIHLKPTMRSSLEKDDGKEKNFTTTLSAHQFHETQPRETVLNIPLNLPKIPSTNSAAIYDDETVPLRIHDSTLNLIIVSDESGMLFVCHYCVYQPIHLPDEETVVESEATESSATKIDTVHFSYSVTLLHHGCIVHCAIPGIPLDKAKYMKPTFAMHGDHHMLIYQPDLFCHLLDVGLTHEPCCHIVCSPTFNTTTEQPLTYLVPCLKWGPIAYDSATLNLISINVPNSHLINAFKNDTSIDNRLSILHYFLVHSNDMDLLSELIGIIMEIPSSLDTVPLLKEAFIGGAYASTLKSLPAEALPLNRLLPLTSCNTKKPLQAKVNDLSIGISQEMLHSTTMMLLSPQQRLSPFVSDIWTKLWNQLNENNKSRARFCPEIVAEKLLYSLACYKPEALSRVGTPMTPGGPLSPMVRRISSNSVLPFPEVESCTATKQEHVISVNLRELSVYLVKHTATQNTGFRWLKDATIVQAPSHVNTVASQYAAAQLELSRALCVFVCRAGGIDARVAQFRGFTLIDKTASQQQRALFAILERYYSAAESIAFPLPHGFASFFTYLAYRALDYEMFTQYVNRNVFELHMDVLAAIFRALGSGEEATERKHFLLTKIPRSRAMRLLKKMDDSRSLRILGRDHANDVLSGASSQFRQTRSMTLVESNSYQKAPLKGRPQSWPWPSDGRLLPVIEDLNDPRNYGRVYADGIESEPLPSGSGLQGPKNKDEEERLTVPDAIELRPARQRSPRPLSVSREPVEPDIPENEELQSTTRRHVVAFAPEPEPEPCFSCWYRWKSCCTGFCNSLCDLGWGCKVFLIIIVMLSGIGLALLTWYMTHLAIMGYYLHAPKPSNSTGTERFNSTFNSTGPVPFNSTFNSTFNITGG